MDVEISVSKGLSPVRSQQPVAAGSRGAEPKGEVKAGFRRILEGKTDTGENSETAVAGEKTVKKGRSLSDLPASSFIAIQSDESATDSEGDFDAFSCCGEEKGALTAQSTSDSSKTAFKPIAKSVAKPSTQSQTLQSSGMQSSGMQSSGIQSQGEGLQAAASSVALASRVREIASSEKAPQEKVFQTPLPSENSSPSLTQMVSGPKRHTIVIDSDQDVRFSPTDLSTTDTLPRSVVASSIIAAAESQLSDANVPSISAHSSDESRSIQVADSSRSALASPIVAEDPSSMSQGSQAPQGKNLSQANLSETAVSRPVAGQASLSETALSRPVVGQASVGKPTSRAPAISETAVSQRALDQTNLAPLAKDSSFTPMTMIEEVDLLFADERLPTQSDEPAPVLNALSLKELSHAVNLPTNQGLAVIDAVALKAPTASSASSSADVVALVDQLVAQMTILKSSQMTETTLTLRHPPLFEGAQIQIQQYKNAAGEFSVSFFNLSTAASALIVDLASQRLLQENFGKNGLAVHVLQVSQSQLSESLFTSASQSGTFKFDNRDGSEGDASDPRRQRQGQKQ